MWGENQRQGGRGGEKWVQKIVIYGRCSFLAFHLTSMGEKCSVPKDELNKYWHTDMVCILAPSHFSNTNTQSFNLSTICDQLNNMWFILKYCKHANCWVCAPARVCTSNHLHCQVKSISMDHRFFSSGTSFFFLQRCHESYKASETTIRSSSQCMYDFSIAFQEMSVSK